MLLNIFVSGNTFFPSDSILRAFEKGPEEILNIYKQQGFLQIKIRVSEDSILIEQGPQFKVGSIKPTGNTIFNDSEILELLTTRHNELFNEFNFRQAIDLVLKKYEDSGYPFCRIAPCNFQFRADTVDFELKIKQGELVKISNIRIEGNESTKEFVILRELNIEQGNIFCESKIRRAKAKVELLEFVESVDINLVGKDELVVNLKEGKVNRAEGLVGYQKDVLIGFLELEMLNLFGTGRVLNICWHKPYKLFNLLELGYKEPWLFGHRIALEGKFSHITEDTLYIKNRAEFLISIPLTSLFSGNAGASGVWVDEETKYSGILGLDFNTRSRPGCHYRIKSEFNLKRIERLLLNADNELLLFPGLYLFISLNYYALFEKNPPLYDRFKLGGAKTLRGYWEAEFSGAKIGWLNLELRKFIGNSFIFPFYDLGYIDGEMKQSYGAGIAVDVPVGLFKVAYGIGEKMDFMQGKIHVLMETRF